MNPAQLIDSIQNMGYRIYLKDDTIKLIFTGKDDPPKEATPIINVIKKNKDELREYLKKLYLSTMENIFNNAVNELSKIFQINAIHNAREMFPKLYEESITAENKINSLWNEGRDIKAFSEAVKEWQTIHMKFIELVQTKKGIDTVMEDVYNPFNRKPDSNQGLGKEVVENGTV